MYMQLRDEGLDDPDDGDGDNGDGDCDGGHDGDRA